MRISPEPGLPAADPVSRERDSEAPALRWGDGDVVEHGVRRRRFDVERAGRTIPGLLWTPTGAVPPGGSRPLVLVGHGGSGSKRDGYVTSVARAMAGHGYATAAIDGPVHGDRRPDGGAVQVLVVAQFAQLWANDGETMTDEMVADWRATLDALQTLPDLGRGPVGWWGLSLGTILGLPLVAAESRIDVAVLGLMGLTGPTRVRIERDAPAVTCPLLFLVQWDDEIFPRDAAFALYGALGSADKRLHCYPGGHGGLPTEGFEASIEFLGTRLGGSGAGEKPHDR